MTIEQLNASTAENLVLVVHADNLVSQNNDQYLLKGVLLSQRNLAGGYRLCIDDNQSDGLTAHSQGTGFFVSSNAIATAAHVLLDANQYKSDDISNIRFIIGFQQGAFEETAIGFLIPKDNIFQPITNNLNSEFFDYTATQQDWALVKVKKLNSEAFAIATPYNLKRSSQEGEQVFCPNFTLGLPLDTNNLFAGQVIKDDENQPYFEIDKPVFGGSSGAPILNTNGEAIGMIVRGAGLLIKNGDCVQLSTTPATHEGTECQRSDTFASFANALGATVIPAPNPAMV